MQIQDLGDNSKPFEDCEVVLTETLLYIKCNTKGYNLYLVDDVVQNGLATAVNYGNSLDKSSGAQNSKLTDYDHGIVHIVDSSDVKVWYYDSDNNQVSEQDLYTVSFGAGALENIILFDEIAFLDYQTSWLVATLPDLGEDIPIDAVNEISFYSSTVMKFDAYKDKLLPNLYYLILNID